MVLVDGGIVVVIFYVCYGILGIVVLVRVIVLVLLKLSRVCCCVTLELV